MIDVSSESVDTNFTFYMKGKRFKSAQYICSLLLISLAQKQNAFGLASEMHYLHKREREWVILTSGGDT